MAKSQKRYAPDRRRRKRRLSYNWRKTWRDWMDRRLPPAPRIQLNHKNIFISPSKAGFAFLALTVVLLLVAINFQNSAVYALTFLLMSVFVVSILHTFSNLSGIALSSHPCEAVFAGRDALFRTALTSPNGLKHYAVQLSWQGKFSDYVDIEPDKEAMVDLRFQVGPRGFCVPGRLKIESRYPFGLLSARTYVDVQHHAIVYPHPYDLGNPASPSSSSYEEGHIEQTGSDDFYGLREYQTGDRIRNIAWRNYAKDGRLAVKQFIDYFDQQQIFDWFKLEGNTEDRLSQLCHWVLHAAEQGDKYGLVLPNKEIAPARGKSHLQAVLTALALYGQEAALAEFYKNQNLHTEAELQTEALVGAV